MEPSACSTDQSGRARQRPCIGRSHLSSTPSERFLRFPASGIAWTSLLSPASEALREDLLKQFVNLNIALLDLVYDVLSELPDVFPRRLAPYGGIGKAVRFVGQPSPPGLRRERSGAPGVAKTEAVASEWSAPARVQPTGHIGRRMLTLARQPVIEFTEGCQQRLLVITCRHRSSRLLAYYVRSCKPGLFPQRAAAYPTRRPHHSGPSRT